MFKINCSAIVINIHFRHCEERFLGRSLSREGTDRGNLDKVVFAKKPGDCFSKHRFAMTWLSSYV